MRRYLKSVWIGITLGIILGTYRGYIALWNETDPQPAHVFPYKASLLPESEQEKLNAGIPIQDEEYLRKLLQDYLS